MPELDPGLHPLPLSHPVWSLSITELPFSESKRQRADAQYAVTGALFESRTVEEAIPRVLASIGKAMEWEAGTFWRRHEKVELLTCSHTWHEEASRQDGFFAENSAFEFQIGEGLPGLVWERGAPEWIPELLAHPHFPRKQLAAAWGLRSGIAFPVFAGPELVGVIEFFSAEPIEADQPLLRALAGIGSELGLFIKRAQTELDLRLSEQRFRTLAETASDAIVTINEQSCILYINPATERLFGFTAEELVGRHLSDLMPERMRAQHEAGLARYLSSGVRNIPWSGVELPALHRSGREFPVEISFGELASGSVRTFTGIMRDVTERVRQQKALEQATTELEVTVEELQTRTQEAETSARVKGDFLAAMSHELRTPLQAVIGYAGLLEDGLHGPVTDEQRVSIERIQASAQHLLGLIEQVLDIARSESGQLTMRSEWLDLCTLASEAVELVRPQAEAKDISLTVGGCPDPRMRNMLGDPGRVRQVLLNLLSNAVKFTVAGEISLAFASKDGKALVQVRDTGVGIPPDQIGRVFEKFYQTEAGLSQRSAGMGLGLAISRDLARSMGGDIALQSEAGRGSTFTLALPLAPATA